MASQVQKSTYALLYHEQNLVSKCKGKFVQSLVQNNKKIAIHKWCKLSKEADRLRKGESPVNGQ